MGNVNMEDRVGQVFGRLVVKSVYREGKRSYAICDCSCGSELTTRIDALKSGATLSCGCYSKEQTALINKSHGMWKSYTWQSWADMKSRCLSKGHKAYQEYKDIPICEKWMEFEGFYEDLGERPPNSTLDRVDGTKGYYKENCRWASGSVQAKNQKKRFLGLSVSDYKGVGRDKRAVRTSGWNFSVTKNYKTLRKACATEIQAAAYFDFCTKSLYSEKVNLNNVDYVLSDTEKNMLYQLLINKFGKEELVT